MNWSKHEKPKKTFKIDSIIHCMKCKKELPVTFRVYFEEFVAMNFQTFSDFLFCKKCYVEYIEVETRLLEAISKSKGAPPLNNDEISQKSVNF